MLDHLSLRDRIFALLIGAIMLGSASSVASIWGLEQMARRGREANRLELDVSETLSRVAAGHLAQTAALERALWEARPTQGPSQAERRFEQRAAAIWEGLRLVRDQLSGAPTAGGSGELLLPLAQLDSAHNEYADRAREVFAALAADRRDEARARSAAADAASQQFQTALGAVLSEAAEHARSELARVREEQRRAIGLVGLLTAGGLLAGAAVVFRAMQLVSRIRSLSGLVPICASCKSIRDDRGYWNQLEQFVEEHSEAQFTHGLCEPCVDKLKVQAKAA